MLAELLTMESSGPLRELLKAYPYKPYGWAMAPEQDGSLVDYLAASVSRIVADGGIAKTYSLGGQMLGLCAVRPDGWASRELNTRTYHIYHLMATGTPQAQMLVKSLLLRDTIREVGGRTCFVARVPYSDMAGINALERIGFSATRTSLALARDLQDYKTCSDGDCVYDVHPAATDEVDAALNATATQIPSGLLGWDSRLPRAAGARVYRSWLRNYATDHDLILAHDHGRTVGLLAEHIHADTQATLGFTVGSVDLVATAPEYRDNGVIPQLMEDTLAGFKRKGVRLAEVFAYSADAPIVKCCQSHGFVTVDSSLILTCWRN